MCFVFIKKNPFFYQQQCQNCMNHFCSPCCNSMKDSKRSLQSIVLSVTGFMCLYCTVLKRNSIRRQHLFLLTTKQLIEFLRFNRISTNNCREKTDLVDLVIQHAKTNNTISELDLAAELIHERQVNSLKEKNELLRQQEQNAQSSSRTSSMTGQFSPNPENIDFSLPNQTLSNNSSPQMEDQAAASGMTSHNEPVRVFCNSEIQWFNFALQYFYSCIYTRTC